MSNFQEYFSENHEEPKIPEVPLEKKLEVEIPDFKNLKGKAKEIYEKNKPLMINKETKNKLVDVLTKKEEVEKTTDENEKTWSEIADEASNP
jgi:hypothetical protein